MTGHRSESCILWLDMKGIVMIDHDNLEEFRDPHVLRHLAARPSDRRFSRHDLCLPETGLARLSHVLVWLLDQATNW